MTKNSPENPKVDWFFEKPTAWQQAFGFLRPIVLATGLVEELKWGCPCYTLQGRNVLLLHGFKEYCAMLFMKGALMADPDGRLIQQTGNVQSARQLRFTSAEEVQRLSDNIRMYILEAIAVEQSGKKLTPQKSAMPDHPSELVQRFEEDRALEKAFGQLTPGRQRAYLLLFTSAKQSATRLQRIDKYATDILEGRGPNDIAKARKP